MACCFYPKDDSGGEEQQKSFLSFCSADKKEFLSKAVRSGGREISMNLLLQPYVMLEDGTVKFLESCGSGCYQGEDVRLWVTYREGAEATAVEVRAQSGRPFHPDCAVGLLIKQIAHLQEYVTATSPYSDYNCWYAPLF